ncbi:MAG: MFS transporter, partial [Bacteroidota bacterium]|nr:MFS transporter [Bacteroidota bacterium]MDX5429819.1 MFS transporter [Bacteroidota bacterium]MDX5468598.1 MFS transporter [Bacteroidota bacterium]
QYVFIGAIIMGISFSLLWQLHKTDSIEYNFAYFLIWSFIFYLGLTIFSVPYVAMGYEMSDDFHERTNIMAVSQWLGQWAWVIAPWFWVIMYDPDWFPSAEVATRTLAVWVGIIFMICAMVPAIFIKSRSTLNENYAVMNLKTVGGSLYKIFHGFVEAFQIRPFRQLCIATFLIFNAFNTVATFTFFIIVYYLFGGNAAEAGIWPTLFGCIGALMTTFLVIPVVAKLSKMLGKKRAFLVSQGISIIGYILLWFLLVPGKPYLFIFALPFFSFGIGSLFTLMMSMTADVIDLDELNTGQRREGIFGAIYWWMVKFGFAIAGLASGAILSSIGFDSSLAEQPEGAITGLRLFFSGLPIAGTGIALLVMWNYNVSEERATEISAEIKARKLRKLAASSYAGNKLRALTNAGGETKLKTDLNFSTLSEQEAKSQFNHVLQSKVHGLCLGAYREGQQIGDTLSKEQIDQRLNIIAPYTHWVRSFSCTDGNEYIPEVAHSKGLKTLAGAWISSDRKRNELEIESLIQLGKAGKVDIAAIGNEVLLREELSEDELIAYILKVKEALPQVKVGYVDAYYQYLEHPKLAEICDIILVNCYPFWEGYSADQATLHLDQMYELTKGMAQGKEVIITETGWPNAGESIDEAVPSPNNGMQYFVNAQNWAKSKGVNLFYFSSFDESWKIKEEGTIGGKWGLWDKHEKLKYQ